MRTETPGLLGLTLKHFTQEQNVLLVYKSESFTTISVKLFTFYPNCVVTVSYALSFVAPLATIVRDAVRLSTKVWGRTQGRRPRPSHVTPLSEQRDVLLPPLDRHEDPRTQPPPDFFVLSRGSRGRMVTPEL